MKLGFWVRIKLALKKLRARISGGEAYYVGGGGGLPPPLSQTEEAYLLSRFYEDRDNVRRILIERNLRLVVYIARKFENTGLCLDDLVSIGTIGLIKAINTFRPEKNIKLATYASRCIENEILMFLRKNSSRKNELSIDEPLNTDWDGNELLLSDVLSGDEEPLAYLDEEVDRGLLRRALSRLEKRDREIIVMRFGLDGKRERTQKEVADMLNISQSYISRLEKRIIAALRKDMQKMM
ncbi:MAG: RNA polymerase sporulation sigma factor SigE [Ruminococcaceae bacterium]|nr:RNA polymerase sporulation sigma factor SigE [Oscillospiraceae bacterium]